VHVDVDEQVLQLEGQAEHTDPEARYPVGHVVPQVEPYR